MGKETKIDWCDHTFNPWWFKHWGEWDADGFRAGKPHAGDVLDGRKWKEETKNER